MGWPSIFCTIWQLDRQLGLLRSSVVRKKNDLKQLLIEIRNVCGLGIKTSILCAGVVNFHKLHAVRACFEGSAGGDFISMFNRRLFGTAALVAQ